MVRVIPVVRVLILSFNLKATLAFWPRATADCVIDLISTYFSKSAIGLSAIWPQSAIAYVIFPGEVALSAIVEFQIKEVANHEKNGDAGFLDYFGGG
jgi:hypothetical protein